MSISSSVHGLLAMQNPLQPLKKQIRLLQKSSQNIGTLPIMSPFEVSYPSFVDEHFDINTNRLGSVYFGDELDFELEFINNYDEDKTYKIETWIVNEKGIKSETKEDVINLKSGEGKSYFARHKSNYYGFSEFFVRTTDQNTGKSYIKSKEFSVLNPPPNGVRNEKQWFIDQTRGGPGFEFVNEKYAMFARAGFAGFRSGISWEKFERTQGAYQFDARSLKCNEALVENDLDILVLLAYSNPIYTNEHPPRSDKAIKAFADYAYNMVLKCKEAGLNASYEVWNEYNCPSFNKDGGTPGDYIRLLKATYEAIKRADPNAQVGGLGGPTYISEGGPGADWIEECLKLGAAEYSDFFTVHPYGPTKPAQVTIDATNIVVDLFKKYGVDDKPFVASETGYSSNLITEWQQMTYAIQQSVVTHDDVDQFCWFINQEKQDVNSDGTRNKHENHFGWIRAHTEEFASPYEPYSAKPVMIAMTNYNRLAAGARFVKKIETNDSDVNAYMFEHRDGMNYVVMWHTSELASKNIGLKLDCGSVTLCDAYGNESKQNVKDGVISLKLTGEPMYVMGDFTDIKLAESEFTTSVDDIKVATDDEVAFYVMKSGKEKAKISVKTPENITVIENNGFDSDNKAKIVLKTGVKNNDGEEIEILVTDESGSVIYYSSGFDVNYMDAVTVSTEASYFRSGRWRGIIQAHNNKSGIPIEATVKITEPEYLAQKIGETILEIPPLSTKEILFDIPETKSNVKIDIEGTVSLSNGEIYPLDNDIYFASINKTRNAPVIDGVFKDGEWDFESGFNITSTDQLRNMAGYGGPDDLSGNVCFKFDKENLYMAAKVNDNILGDNDSNNRIWACDSIQFAFTNNRVAGAQRTEYGIGLINGQPALERYAYLGLDEAVIDNKDSMGYLKTSEYVVLRNEEKKETYYECRIPWNEIYDFTKYIPYTKESLYFSMLINDNDGSGRRGWMEYCPGIGTDKNPALFIEVPVYIE